jgi:hypothetical protein
VVKNSREDLNHAEETVEGNGSVWFGDLMRNARTSKSVKCAKQNGDRGTIRGASLEG